MNRLVARLVLGALLATGLHVVAPTRAAAGLRAATACASHCAKTRPDDGCPPRCCVVAPDGPSAAPVPPASQPERPAAGLVLTLAPAVAAAPLDTWFIARREVPPRAGPLYLAVLTLRL